METKRRLFGLIAIIAIIVLLATACDSGLDLPDVPEIPGGEKAVYTSVDSEGNTYELTIIPKSDKAAYDPQAGDSYTLTIYYLDGTTKTSVGTVTHKVKTGSTTTATLSVSETSFTVTLKTDSDGLTVMTEIKGEIPISGNDDDDTPPSIEIELTLNPKEDGGGNVDVPVTGVTLNKSSLYLKAGEEETLVAPILPFNATNKAVTWKSSNTAVAIVSASGEVSAVAPGSAVITVTTVDGNFTASCEITVTGEGEYVPVAYVSLNKYELFLSVGESETLRATVSPPNASNKNVTWSSNNTDVATVSANGLVKGVANGETLIGVTTEDGNHSVYCPVTVGARDADVTGVTLSDRYLTLVVGNTKTLTATVEPPNAKNKAVTWYSSDPTVASVSASGVVKGISVGWSLISVTTVDGDYFKYCDVQVISSNSGNGNIVGITLNKTETGLLVGGTEYLTYSIQLNSQSEVNMNVIWSSSNPSVATIEDGLLTGISAGKATITATTVDGGHTASCEVTVSGTVVPVTGISLDYTEYDTWEGNTAIIEATVSPANATNQNITWTSSNNGIATVSSIVGRAFIAGKSPGKVTITATTVDGGKTASCSFTVYPAFPKEITLNKSSINIFTYGTETLELTLVPSDARYLDVVWSSSNPSVAKISWDYPSFLVTGISPGEAVITATTQNGLKATCKVTVSLVVIPEGLASYLSTLPANTASNPYNIPLKFSNAGEFLIIKKALQGEPNKFVILDLSASTITSITSNAFNDSSSPNNTGCATLVGITIPDSVDDIGWYAFQNCTSLSSITIPGSVTFIGPNAFFGCTSLKSVNIGNGVTNIRESAFEDCTSLSSITIPNSVTRIWSSAFRGCTSLASVTIPDSVTSMDWNTFYGCTSLASVSIPNSITSIPVQTFYGCISLASVSIPNSITSIGGGAFRDCSSLTNVTIAETSKVTSIGDMAFSGCASLASINIPNSVTSIGEPTYSYMTRIEATAFSNCTSLVAINVGSGNSAYSSEDGVLYNKNKTALFKYPERKTETAYNIPNSVSSIGDYAFSNCLNLTSVTFAETSKVTSIGRSAFYGCSILKSVNIPDSVTSIGERAFFTCTSLASVTLGNSVNSIGDYAFYRCTSLAKVTIPSSVTSIGFAAFYECARLSSVTFLGTIPSSEVHWYFPFDGDLREKFYATDKDNGTPGTYTTSWPTSRNSTWTLQQ